jgi:hypothetical protein
MREARARFADLLDAAVRYAYQHGLAAPVQ